MLQAKGLCFLLCLAGAVWAADEETDFSLAGATGRGPRIVEHGAQSSCLQEKSWPFCSDEDWGPKCPSGCRMKGLIDQTDRNFGKRMDFIRKQLIDNQNNYKSTDVTTKEIQQMIKDKLTQGQDGDNAFGTTAEELRRRIELLKQTVVRNVNRIINLQSSIQNQVVEMKRLEVDIDIKIRACKGSCSQGYNYNVDTESYDTIQKSFQQAGAINLDPSISQSNSLSVLKMRPVKDTLVAEHFKSLPKTGPDTQFNIFADIQQKAMVLERQGKEVKVPFVDPFIPTPSSTFPGSKVSVTKVDGGQPTGIGIEKQIFTGGEDKSTTTFTSHGRTVKCTKTITKKIIHGPSGPREELVETVSGGEGDECAHLLTKLGTDPASGVAYNIRVTSSDGLGDISKFPSFEEFLSGGAGSSFHSSSSSSSSSSKSSPFETKSMKSGFIPEDLRAVQQDQADSVTWTDCDDIHQKHVSGAKSGIFRIRPEGSNNVLSVYCDQDTVFGGWLLIQQRENGSVNFNRTWQDYKTGFGSVDAHGKGELWLGNEHIHLLTQKNTVLRVELEDWSGEEAYAEYSIQVRPESEDYALKVSQYVGTAGDALIQGSPEDEEYTSHNNMKFSTADRDSDQWEDNCAEVYGGGWWYNNCQGANLNGIYYMGGQYDPRNNVPYEIENGVVWLRFRTADYSLKTVRMKIRPRNLH
ncbi:fibrinogen alpha chain isoform X2 [Microcaecilia unicolor]|uniref:Fibrinogen alpha chain isoform X2 n=1 Tax=Microcaecilia unicolor TaxID=1415580 RepID=A0A6P7X4U0_9AMPH|nr:fibrinogen alpha chain isoform X2 [Microcaecilia unicolor]